MLMLLFFLDSVMKINEPSLRNMKDFKQHLNQTHFVS